jgi:Flp pilus assembly protein TadG
MGHRRLGLAQAVPDAPRERGAAITEMALLLPILLLLVLGVFELGAAFKSYLTTSNAAREGTRLLSARGTDELADCLALVKAVDALSLANDFNSLDRIEIFQANPSTGDPVPGTTNTYTYSAGDPTDCSTTAPNCGSWTCTISQPPASRSALVGASTSPDLIGMRIVYQHDWLTGFPPFSGSITIDEQTISRLEPEGFA